MASHSHSLWTACAMGGCLLCTSLVFLFLISETALTSEKSELECVLSKTAPQKEVLLTLSDMGYYRQGILSLWLENVIKSDVQNFLVVATDNDLFKILQDLQIPVYLYLYRPAAQNNTGSSHAISAVKYGLLQEILSLGWNVLLSDADVVTLKDPFHHLYRDADIEAMSDGYEEASAYGSIIYFDDLSMGWSRYSQGTQHANLNSGLFYIQSTARSIALMHRLKRRLEREAYWDQQAFNEEIFFLRHGETTSTGVTVRVMDIYAFMNSKTLFKRVRYDPESIAKKPVLVHINYHPDKKAKMSAVRRFYEGVSTALDDFSDGVV